MAQVVRIARVKGLSASHAAGLKAEGIETFADLWSRVGEDYDHGIEQVARDSKVPNEVITALLVAEGLGQARIKHGWLNQSLILTVLLAVLLLALGSWLFTMRTNLPQQVVVVNPRGIQPFRVIAEDDVALKRVPFRRGQTVSDLQTAIGSCALTKLEPQTPIRSDQILPANTSSGIAGKFIVSVPVKMNSLVLAPKSGSRIALLPLSEASKNTADTPLTSPIEAILLGIDERKEISSLIVAVDSVEKINSLVNGATIVGVIP